ncbi:hypothetical protein [Stenotrophomonas nitritireducens]|uniref:Phage tail protein n=1 Tax=Stenotrophomonas nitritireducens TaxID=83617 RepID=A0ABR5NFG2_9GAMM|nr:hypothetical protein [Stenotrophomonas nitritireducens]KRG53617.1 hypothetical protein ABB22_17410 [Stenotrophomonas nitritireducens]
MADEYTATDFNGLPPAATLEGTDVVPLQRGTGADSTKRTTVSGIAAKTLAGILTSSGVRATINGDQVTIEGVGAAIVEITGSAYTLGLQNMNRFNPCNNATAQTITIPPQSSVAWPNDIQLEGAQTGAGAVTFVAGPGVTLRKSSDITATTKNQYSPWGLKRIGLNEWLLFGKMGGA